MARGLVVTPPPARPRKAKPAPTFLRKPGGTGILMPPGSMPARSPHPARSPCRCSTRSGPSAQAEAAGRERHSAHLVSRRHHAVSRRAPPPARARRPARRDPPRAAPPGARRGARQPAATGPALRALAGRPRSGRTRRVWPLRPGRPPGQPPANRRRRSARDPERPPRSRLRRAGASRHVMTSPPPFCWRKRFVASNSPRTLSRVPHATAYSLLPTAYCLLLLPTRPCVWPYPGQPFPVK